MRGESDPEHERWIQEALAGFERPLVAYATRLLRGDVDAGRDVVQETFLRLCRTPRGEVEGGLRAWLFTVCRNRALDVLRKEKRMGTLDQERVEELPSSAPAPSAGLEEHDAMQRVLEILAVLPEKQREVLRLKFQHGLSYAEIGRVTRQKTGTVGWLIHEGMRELRSRLEPGGLRGVEV